MGNVKLANGLLNDCYRFVTSIDNDQSQSIERMSSVQVL